MSYNYTQFKACIVDSTLLDIDLYSPEASILLLATMAQESNFGTYLHQIRGPAISPYQIEPATHKDIWDNYLKYRPELAANLANIVTPMYFRASHIKVFYEKALLTNLSYSTAIARIKYYRVKEKLPEIHPIAMGEYWKHYYNTPDGIGTVAEFVENWKIFIEPNL